jgi:hypothetical protein
MFVALQKEWRKRGAIPYGAVHTFRGREAGGAISLDRTVGMRQSNFRAAEIVVMCEP